MSKTTNLIYGHHPVVEAIQAGKAVEKVFSSKEFAVNWKRKSGN